MRYFLITLNAGGCHRQSNENRVTISRDIAMLTLTRRCPTHLTKRKCSAPIEKAQTEKKIVFEPGNQNSK